MVRRVLRVTCLLLLVALTLIVLSGDHVGIGPYENHIVVDRRGLVLAHVETMQTWSPQAYAGIYSPPSSRWGITVFCWVDANGLNPINGPYAVRLLRSVTVSLPWLLALLIVPVVVGLLRDHQARLRARRLGKLCLTCGYDLRATPDRCPECGTPVHAVVVSQPQRGGSL